MPLGATWDSVIGHVTACHGILLLKAQVATGVLGITARPRIFLNLGAVCFARLLAYTSWLVVVAVV